MPPRRTDDMRPVAYPALDRFANVVVTLGPLVLLGVAVWQAWANTLHWRDIAILGVGYVLTGFGVTVGYHRLLTHRSFKTSPALRGVFAVLGSAAIEGPAIEWVATHRKHHAFSDEEGDPHSPHVGYGSGFVGAFKGLFYAHVGWVLRDVEVADESRYAKDLLDDPVVRFVDRTFLLWVAVGLAIPFGVGVALSSSLAGGLTALLWGGGVRIFVGHQVTFCINSLCHFFGRRPFATGDESRNLAWLALPTFGESWHNNHHAFPTSARHGLGRGEVDISAGLVTLLEKAGLAWDVVRVPPDRQLAKRA
jgi:stearoyl-CoA desaturase (Delta-9 desaturase)